MVLDIASKRTVERRAELMLGVSVEKTGLDISWLFGYNAK